MREVKECAFDRASTKAYMVREWVCGEIDQVQTDIKTIQEYIEDRGNLNECWVEHVERYILADRAPGELEAWEEKLLVTYERLCDLSDELESCVKDPSEVHGEVNRIIKDFGLELHEVGTFYVRPDSRQIPGSIGATVC